MQSKLTVLILMLLLNAGCSSKNQLAELLVMPTIPDDKKQYIQVKLPITDGRQLGDDVVQLDSHSVKPGSTVVIHFPEVPTEKSSEQTRPEFESENYSETEQHIERELIRRGFRVLSRSKFEAKMLSYRSMPRCNINDFECVYHHMSDEDKHVLDTLKLRKLTNEITTTDFSKKLESIRRQQIRVASASNVKVELDHVARVLQVADQSDIQAEYILQVNVFDKNHFKTVNLDLRHDKAVRDFIRAHPGLESDFSDHTYLSCVVAEARMNAKLIHVASGEIVWIGEHDLNELSSGVESVSVEFGKRTAVANADAIKQFVHEQNGELVRRERYGQAIKIPDFSYQEHLIKPVVSAGKCPTQSTAHPSTDRKLSQKIVRDLIGTIQVTDQVKELSRLHALETLSEPATLESTVSGNPLLQD